MSRGAIPFRSAPALRPQEPAFDLQPLIDEALQMEIATLREQEAAMPPRGPNDPLLRPLNVEKQARENVARQLRTRAAEIRDEKAVGLVDRIITQKPDEAIEDFILRRESALAGARDKLGVPTDLLGDGTPLTALSGPEQEEAIERRLQAFVPPEPGETQASYVARFAPQVNVLRQKLGLPEKDFREAISGRTVEGSPTTKLGRLADTIGPVSRGVRSGLKSRVESQGGRDRTLAGEAAAAFGRGSVGLVESAGGVAQAGARALENTIGPNQASGALRDAGSIARDLGETAQQIEPPSDESSTARKYVNLIGESAPQVVGALGAGAATGGAGLPAAVAVFAGTSAAPVVGSIYNESVRDQVSRGVDPLEAIDKATNEAAIGGTITLGTSVVPGLAILRSVPGGNRAVAAATRSVLARVGTAAVAEGSQEVAEEIGQEAVRILYRDNGDAQALAEGLLDPEFGGRLADSFIVGGVLGGAARAGGEAGPLADALADRAVSRGTLSPERAQQAARDFAEAYTQATPATIEIGKGPIATDDNGSLAELRERVRLQNGVISDTETEPVSEIAPDENTEPAVAPEAAPEPQTEPVVAEPQTPTPEVVEAPPSPSSPPAADSPQSARGGEFSEQKPRIDVPSRPRVAKARPSKRGEFSRTDIERRVVSIAENRVALDDSLDIEQSEAGTALIDAGIDPNTSFSFQGAIPTGVREAVRGTALSFSFRGNVRGGTGEDAIAEIGVDSLIELAETLREGRSSAAFDAVQYDEEGRFLAAVHDEIGPRAKTDVIDHPTALPADATFTIAGEPFRVEIDEDGGRYIAPVETYASADATGLDVLERRGSPIPRTNAQALDVDSGGGGLVIDRGSLRGAADPQAGVAAFLDRQANAARRRIAQRASGSQLASGFDPTILADYAIIGADLIVKGAKQFADFASRYRDANVFAASFTDEQVRQIFDEAKKTERAARRHVRDEPVRPRREQPKTRIRRVTGQTDTSPAVKTTERKALRDRLKSDERASERGRRAGVKEGRAQIKATLPVVRQRLRDQIKAKSDLREEYRSQLIKLVRDHLPVSERGRFIPDIRKATTPKQLLASIRKLDREVSLSDGRSYLASIDRRTAPKKIAKIPLDERRELRELRAESQVLKQTLRRSGFENGKKPTTSQVQAADRRLAEIDRRVKEIVAIVRDEKSVKAEFLNQTRDQIVGEVVRNINQAAGKRVKQKASRGGDFDLNLVNKSRLGSLDLRSVTMEIEGDFENGKILHKLMFDDMVKAEEAYLSELRDTEKSLTSAAERAGFQGLGDAFAKLSGTYGEASQEIVEIPVIENDSPSTMRVSMGEAMAIAAMDPDTRALVESGSRLQRSIGKEQEPFHIDADGLARIDEIVGEKNLRFIREVKQIFEDQRSRMFPVIRRLRGYEPDPVEGYFPRSRNIRYTDRAGLAENWKENVGQASLNANLENLGFTKERSHGGDTPIVVQDFLGVTMQHIDDSAKMIHLAEPTRNASMVIMHPKVRTAINKKFGRSTNNALAQQLMNASRANSQLESGFGKLVRDLNRKAAISFLALNPGTLAKQVGGVFRLGAEMRTQDFAYGLANVAEPDFEKMIDSSGYLWDRYRRNVFGRFSAVASGAPGASKPSTKAEINAAFSALGRAIKARDARSIDSSWRQVSQLSMGGINALDAFVSRVAYAGHLNESRRLHKDWSEDQHYAWAGRKTSDTIRETQNSTSPIDLTNWAAASRGDALSAGFLFTSDYLKAYNRLVRARKTGRFASHAAAEAANVAWGAVSSPFAWTVALTPLVLGIGDTDDLRELWGESFRVDRLMQRFLRELVGPAAGFTPNLLAQPFLSAMSGFSSSSAFETPVTSLADDAIGTLNGIMETTEAIRDGDTNKATDKALKTFERGVLSAMAIWFGNPLHAASQKAIREIRKELQEG